MLVKISSIKSEQLEVTTLNDNGIKKYMDGKIIFSYIAVINGMHHIEGTFAIPPDTKFTETSITKQIIKELRRG